MRAYMHMHVFGAYEILSLIFPSKSLTYRIVRCHGYVDAVIGQ